MDLRLQHVGNGSRPVDLRLEQVQASDCSAPAGRPGFGVGLIVHPIRETINAVDGLDIGKVTRAKIYSGNLERLLKLP